MDRILTIFLKFLRKLRFSRGFTHHFFRRWALLLAFLGRRFGVWYPRNGGKGDTVTRRKTESADHSFRGTMRQLDSREWVAPASYVPTSASNPRQHHVSNVTRPPQPATSWAATNPPDTHLTAEPRGDCAYPTSGYRTHSHELATVGRSSQFSRAAHSRLGHEMSASPSSESLSRAPSPGVQSPLLPSSHAHDQSSSPSGPGHHRKQSSTSVAVDIESPSSESPHPNPSTGPLSLTEEPYTIGSSTAHSSPISDSPHIHDGPPRLPILTLSNPDLPSRCHVKPMYPDQVPRYTKAITV